MRKREPARVLGPYQEGATWRIIHIDGSHQRRSYRLPSERAARRKKQHLEQQIRQEPRLTLKELTERYVAYLRDVRAVKPVTLLTVRSSLARFFAEAMARSPAFSREAAEGFYAAHTKKRSQRGDKTIAVATQQLDLKIARRLYRWASKKGLLADNPWQAVEPIGRMRVGKPQLRIEEARRFLAGALHDLQQGDRDALAPLLSLLMGLRAGEVMERSSRDVDDGGRLLWIDGGKTERSRRHLRVPAILSPYLAELAAAKRQEPFLFGSTPAGGPPTYRLTKILRRLCRRYEVPQVCPHSLYGQARRDAKKTVPDGQKRRRQPPGNSEALLLRHKGSGQKLGVLAVQVGIYGQGLG